MPSCPSPAAATRVSRSWIAVLRSSAATASARVALAARARCPGALASMQAGIGQRDARLLRQHPQHELLGRRRLRAGAHDEIAEMAVQAPQRVRPTPRFVQDADPAPGGAEHGELGLEVGSESRIDVGPPFSPTALAEVGAHQLATRQRGDSRRGQMEDHVLVVAVGHPHREAEQHLQARELLPQLRDAAPSDTTAGLIPSRRGIRRPSGSAGSRARCRRGSASGASSSGRRGCRRRRPPRSYRHITMTGCWATNRLSSDS